MPKKKHKQTLMFTAGEDLPLFSGVAQKQKDERYNPRELPVQHKMPGFDWQPTLAEMAANKDKILRPKRRRRPRR